MVRICTSTLIFSFRSLKNTGILMIIGGALSLILALVAVAGIAALAYLADGNVGILYAAGALTLVGAVAELVAGIVGVKNCKKPEKAGTCMVWGIIVAALSVLGNLLNVAGGQGFSVSSLLLGLVLPVLFIVGAVKNKQSA